jgi:hypothetical protein
MELVKRIAFFIGLLLGLASVAAVGTVALTYLFTGKFASVELAEGKPEITLMSADQVVAMVREQVEKSKAAQAQAEGDDGHGEA